MEFKGFKNCRYKKFKIDENNNKTIIDGKNDFSLEEVKGWDESLAFVVPEGCVVVDVDDTAEGKALLECIKDTGTKCFASKSTRGYHFYFRIPRGMKIKNNTHITTPLGLTHIDYRSGQSTSLIIEYRNGKWCDWLIAPQPDDEGEFSIDPYKDLDDLPFFLYPLNSNLNSFCGMDEGDGRNNTLNAHRTRLVVNYAYDQTKINELFRLINNYVFARPLSTQELDSLCQFREVDKRDTSQRWFDGKTFLHNELGEFLIENMNAFRDEANQTYYFNNEYYSMDDRVIEEKIVELCPQLTIKQRKEVISYVKLARIKHETQPLEYHNWICCKNCLVDADTGNTMGFNPAIFLTTQLDVNYDPNAYDENVDKFLNEVLVEFGDKEQRMIFEEYLGYTLIAKDNFMKKMLFMIGPNANNGKSTTLYMVQQMLTQKNYSSLKISQISESNAHVLAGLCDKQANFDDDADNSIIRGSTMSYLKTIISDENKITINPKYREPFQKFIRAKFWIATNHIIKTEQKGNEWLTRLILLAFNNQFQGAKRDPLIKNRLKTDSAKSYLLKLAIEGYQRLLKQGDFTESAESKKWIRQYQIENDTVFKYLFTKQYDSDYINNKTLKSLFTDYKNFMDEEEITYKVNMNTFEKRLIEYYGTLIMVEVKDGERYVKVNNIVQ